MRRIGSPLRRIAVTAALSVPFLLAFLLVSEAWLRWTTNLPYLSRTRCFTQNPEEGVTFRPGCEETLRTPDGPVLFHTNEDGLRDRPRAFFGRGAIAVLGDSFLEGFWLDEARGLARAFERRLGLPYPLLNLSIRGSGPSQQALRLRRAESRYSVRGALWFLNPSDPIDEMYFLARNPEFRIDARPPAPIRELWEPTPGYWWWTNLSLRFRDRIYIFVYVAEKWIKQRWQAALVEGQEFREDRHCRTLASVADSFRASGRPLLFVALPHGLRAGRRPYLGVPIREELFDRLLDCARKTGAPVADLRGELDGHPEWYFRNDWHFNAAGVEAVTSLVAPRIRAAWPASPPTTSAPAPAPAKGGKP